MEKNKNNKRKIIAMTGVVIGLMVITLSVSYSFFSYRKSSESSNLIAGDIYMHYKGQNTGINIDNAVPSETYDEDEYFEFTIEGKNTYTEKDIWYEIDLVYGDEPEERNTRIRDNLLKFTLFEKVGNDGVETKVLDGVSYQEINNKKIWVNKIDKNTTEETKITYKLYMWISNDTVIGDNGDYTITEWNEDIYASVKVNVKGDFNEKSLEPSVGTMITTILDKAYTDKKEIIALDVTDKNNVTKCDSVEACKGKKVEYRYSGPEVNNYIYLTNNTNEKEKWRIIGIFKDPIVGQYIKVVRDEVLPTEKIADYYTAYEQKYKIKSSNVKAYWNRFEPYGDTSPRKDKNDWVVAGLQYWLNSDTQDSEGNKGYLNYLSSNVRDQLVSVKHYLGAVHIEQKDSNGYVIDTPKEAYKHERDVESCTEGKGPSSNDSRNAIESESLGCHVWAGYDATWTGKVSLMYPSDYGFTADETNWTTKLGAIGETASFSDITTSWAFSTMSDAKSNYTWLLSPTSYHVYSTAQWDPSGSVSCYNNVFNFVGDVRPVLNISYQATYIKGDGTSSSPYEIIAN